MGTLEIASVEVFTLMRRGRRIAFALSESALFGKSRRRTRQNSIARELQDVGLVRGEVFDWSKRGGHSFNAKLHWTCPQCGQRWWEDFFGTEDNPYFAGSGCRCVRSWLVQWNAEQAKAELNNP